MTDSERHAADRRLAELVGSVRRRWKLRLALRGLAWAAGISVLVFLVSAFALERARFDDGALFWLRSLSWTTLAVTLYLFVIRPILRPVTDSQVALYLEEHEPTLDHTVVSALEASRAEGFSPALTGRVLQHALERAESVENGRRIEQTALYRFGGALSGVVVAGLLFTLLGPASLRYGISALLSPTRDATEVNPYAVEVAPGDAAIPRGSDLMVRASLRGFESGEVSIFTSSGDEPGFRRLSMLPDDEGAFEAMLLAVDQETRYFVEAAGVRSPTYTIEVAELPYVDEIEITYRFPSYTGLPPRVVERGGDVAALAGTVVELRISPTIATPGGRLLVDGAPSDLVLGEDGTLTARFTVEQPGLYAVELARSNGALIPASPEYTIDVLDDLEPSIRFTRPGRDMPASPIEEIYLEMEALDDYGVGDVRLVYSVNGGGEDTVSVFRTNGSPLPEVSAGHTLYLEEWQLEPGDLVSYYALVRDNRGTERVVASDMFFLNVRPFERAYREAEQQGGGGGGGAQQGGAETALSEMQRQIISATFNLIRQRDSYRGEEFSENVVSVALAQERLREQVQTLLERMGNRGLTDVDPGFRDVSAVLPLASEAMVRAHESLSERELRDALPAEQEALRYLQQAEETYERYVSQQQNQGGGGGGGGGGNPAADDLADLFELELDKLQNQYETVRRGAQQQADAQVDELLEQLQELARRQEQEAERQRRRAQAGAQGAPGAGESQRNLAEETEEAARQLQRLARERSDAELQETARSLQEAADAMRRSASEGGNAASTGATEALRRLSDARRSLEETRAGRAGRDAQEALRQVDELQRQQREVQQDVRALPASGPDRREAIDRLRDRKNQMTEAVRDLEQELDRAASATQAENPDAARRLQAGANQIRESSLKEKLQYSRGTIEQWDPQSAVTLELSIEGDLQALRDELEGALDAAGAREQNPLTEALEETRDLVRGMEAMRRRLNEPGQQSGQQGQPGQQGGQPGQEGGQPGQEGGQPGQEGGQPGQEGGQPGQEGGQPGQQGGQPGQEGGQPGQEGGQPGGGGGERGLTGDRANQGPWAGGGPTSGNPRALSPEEVRQFRSEFEQRAEQIRDLRNQLRDAGRPADDLQAVLDAMTRLSQEGAFEDPTQVAQLQAEALEALKRLEFGLRREVEGESPQRARLSGSDDVPEGYRALVEEYYRTLARGGGS